MESTGSRFGFKVSLIGDYAVGKTSLIKRYMTDTFEEGYKATLGAAISTFQTNVGDTEVSLQVWDLAGQTSFRRVRVQYLFGSDFGVVVFDLTRPESLEAVKEWVADIRQNDPEVLCILVGNKSDLEEDRAVTVEAARSVAKELGISEYMETSAKSGSNVRELFHTIAKDLFERAKTLKST